jgi:DNA-binding NarL/FixJ family response regulator
MAPTKPNPNPKPPPDDAPADKQARVFIVDDHELLRNGLADYLNDQPDMQVCGQASGEREAWEMALQLRPDLAIVDVSLVEGNGIDLIKRLAHHDPSLKTVVLSSYDESLYAERGMRAGAKGFINKQLPARKILAAIRQVLSGSLYVSERMTAQLVQRATGKGGPSKSPVETLSNRELEVFTLIGRGLSSAQIGKELHVSPRTVDTYRERLKSKLKLESGVQLNRAAAQWELENR